MIGWLKGDSVGRRLLLEDVMGDDRGTSEKYLEVASLWHRLGVLGEEVGRESALVRLRTADLLAIMSESTVIVQYSA